MNKYMMMGLLLAASVSFAMPRVDMGTTYGRVFMQSDCESGMVYSLLGTAQGEYGYYDGHTCQEFDMTSERNSVYDAFFGDGSLGVVNAYENLLDACGRYGQSSSECASAKATFYSTAASARAAFRSAKATYQRAAALAVWSYRVTSEACGNPRSEILSDMQSASSRYRDCLLGPR